MSIADIQKRSRDLIAKTGPHTPAPASPLPHQKARPMARTYDKQVPTPSKTAWSEILFLAAELLRRNHAVDMRDAIGQVTDVNPELYAQHVQQQRAGQNNSTVTKTTSPTYDTICKQAATLMRQQALSKREALMVLIDTHPDERAYQQAYRTYHLGEGREEYEAARIAKYRQA